MSRLLDADRLTGAPVRYEACHPGALLHQDHKKLGRVPDGGGRRVLGREGASRHRGLGYDHFEVFVDDRQPRRLRGARRRRARRAPGGRSSARRPSPRPGRAHRARPHRQRQPYRSQAYATTLERLGARHKRTRPYRPQTNGKAERFIRTLLDEWAYARPYRSNASAWELPLALDYNHGRPHTALGGLVPHAALVNNLGGNHN